MKSTAPWAFALVVLLASVAWRWGGYDPWAVLVLELGAAGLFVALSAKALWVEEEAKDVRLARLGVWKRLSVWIRHPDLADFLRLLTFGSFPARRRSPEVEILLPSSGSAPIELDPAREVFLLGHPFRRNGLLVPVSLLSFWILLSLVPLERTWLSVVSPEASRLRAEAEQLIDAGTSSTAQPWTLAPFMTLRSLWLWLAFLSLFYVASRVARRPRGATQLALLLLILGALSGGIGIADWLTQLEGAYGRASDALRASGSFGNPNHYASFQSMLLLVSLGWLAHLRGPKKPAKPGPPRRETWNDPSLALIAGLGILVLALGLVLSLSRSGITSAFLGALSFILLIRPRHRVSARRGNAWVSVSLLALAVALVTVWLGAEPILGRFANLDAEWEKEGARVQVWRDSLGALADFALTGSGLSTFRYVGAAYRSFGGTVFFSWAHNDFLQLGIELGVPGLLLLGWIGVSVFRAARRVRNDLEEETGLLHLHAGFASAIVAVVLHSVADFSLHLPANFGLLAVIVGVVVGMERGRRQRS